MNVAPLSPDGDDWVNQLPETDDRRVVLRLLNAAYSAASGLLRQAIALDDNYDSAALQELYEQVGDFLWPSDKARPEDRWARDPHFFGSGMLIDTDAKKEPQ